MKGRKYIAVTALSWLIIVLIGAYFSLEGWRMGQAEEGHTARDVAMGLRIYAQNCVVCHGPLGEGVVGPPLNREEFRVHPAEDRETYELLARTVRNGRPGSATPHWVRLPNGEWASYTAMPTWGIENGGPLNEQEIRAVATFMMLGDWHAVSAQIPAPTLPEPGAPEAAWMAKMPDGVGLTAAQNAAGKRVFVEKGCATCHTLGSLGGRTGPDLTKLGSWGVSPAFLREWIKNPAAVENRAPVYWSNYSGPLLTAPEVTRGTGEAAPGRQQAGGATSSQAGGRDAAPGGGLGPEIEMPAALPLGPTQMPSLGLTEQELDVLVTYLSRLR